MKTICLSLILLCSSCTINKGLRNAEIEELGPTSLASINLGALQTL